MMPLYFQYFPISLRFELCRLCAKSYTLIRGALWQYYFPANRLSVTDNFTCHPTRMSMLQWKYYCLSMTLLKMGQGYIKRQPEKANWWVSVSIEHNSPLSWLTGWHRVVYFRTTIVKQQSRSARIMLLLSNYLISKCALPSGIPHNLRMCPENDTSDPDPIGSMYWHSFPSALEHRARCFCRSRDD